MGGRMHGGSAWSMGMHGRGAWRSMMARTSMRAAVPPVTHPARQKHTSSALVLCAGRNMPMVPCYLHVS